MGEDVKWKSDEEGDPRRLLPQNMQGAQYDFELIHHTKIVVGKRHREDYPEASIKELAASIAAYGLLQPIVVRPLKGDRFSLVAGGRRLRAIVLMGTTRGGNGIFWGWPNIPAHFVDNIPDHTLKEMELEENLRREDLDWKEESLAFLDYLETRQDVDSDFTVEQCAEALRVSKGTMVNYAVVGRALRGGHKLVTECNTRAAAWNVLSRELDRAKDEEIAKFTADPSASIADLTGEDLDLGGIGPEHSQPTPAAVPRHLRAASLDIYPGSFLDFINEYEGPPFNFIHCDFPYGVGQHKSDQGGSATRDTYVDTEEVYWELINLLIQRKDEILAPQAHIMFWFSMKFYSQTVGAFKRADFKVDPFPLIWYKSDKQGILPDPQRGPRRIYETALLMSTGDRKVVKSVVNAIDYPLAKHKAMHLSEKPQPVLDHFFTMLVDKSTRMLDPTCGCGGSIIAAERAGAQQVQGADIDPACVQLSTTQLTNYRQNKEPLQLDLDLEADLNDLGETWEEPEGLDEEEQVGEITSADLENLFIEELEKR